MTDDARLLRQYAETGSEPAFAELVSRHVDLVYSVARRLVGGDTHLAEDVVQTVFFDLSRKAGGLPTTVVLAGWLCRHAFFVASTKVRSEQRRRAREMEAVRMTEPPGTTEPDWERLSPVLDEALQALGPADRDALVLRYFQGCNYKAVGLALGTNEDSAQKRVSRALERLRQGLSKRGVTVGVVGLATVLSTHAVSAAPAGMAGHVAAAVLTGAGTGSGSLVSWIEFMAWAKTKVALASAAMVVAGVVTTTWWLRSPGESPTGVSKTDFETAVGPADEAATPVVSGGGRSGLFHWSQVESTDYRQYVANLRAIGCPESTIRDIILADVQQTFMARQQAIWKPAPSAYWEKSPNMGASPEQVQRLAALDQEKGSVLRELLGTAVSSQELTDLLYQQQRSGGTEFLFLPTDRREAAQRVLLESGFAEKQDQVLTNRGSDGRELFDEKLRVLSTVLAPDELEEYRLRHSPRANWLRGEVSFLKLTHEEFKALLDMRDEQLKEKPDHLGPDRAAALEQARQVLGEERAKEYARVSDHGYLNGRRVGESMGLPEGQADQAGQIVFEARLAVEQIARDSSRTQEERLGQVEAIRTQAEERLRNALGVEVGSKVGWALRSTLGNTVQVNMK